MHKSSRNSSAYTPWTARQAGDMGLSSNVGVRPSVQRVLSLIDTTDPAWPAVAEVLQEFMAAAIEIDETTAPLAVKLGKQRATAGFALRTAEGIPSASASGSIVYYVRRGKYIKIGTTIAPHARFRDLMPDEILAVEPGGRAEERRRHSQFALLRLGGEHFRDEPELRAHIARVRALHGPPNPSWPSGANLERSAVSWASTPASSSEVMSAAEAVTELGIKETTVRAWRSRGRLPVAGVVGSRLYFYREHLVALRDSVGQRDKRKIRAN